MDNAVSLLPKKTFFTVYGHKILFAVKIANHHDKQLTPLEICDQDGFFEPWFWVSSYSNYEAIMCRTLWVPNQVEHLDRLL